MKKQWISLSLIAGLGLFTMASCGSDTTKETTVETEQVQTDVVNDEVVELSIEGDDAMKFNKNQLHAKAGQTVKLTLTHTGTMDINVMGHNCVLLNADADLDAFIAAAQVAKETDYIPASHEGDIIAHTDMIGGGESASVEFTAPAPGKYTFICSFPGHAGMMKGVLIVE